MQTLDVGFNGDDSAVGLYVGHREEDWWKSCL